MKAVITAHIHKYDGRKWVVLGYVSWDGEKLTAEGSPGLDNILKEPVWLPDGRTIHAKDDPELFVRSLYLYYKSVYLRASSATEHR